MDLHDVINRLKDDQLTRFLAFGSSNTQRRVSGMHWFDCFELAITQTYGKHNRCVNTGVGGDSTLDLLRRFNEDAAFYKPHLAFVTIGGNDSNQPDVIPPERYRENLLEIHRMFAETDCAVVFQTYYSPDPDRLAYPLDNFYGLMDIVRHVAEETGSSLIDHLARWEVFRRRYPEEYQALMVDGFHVNHVGNMLMGVDVARHFDAHVGEDLPDYWNTAKDYQNKIDKLI